LVVVRSARSPTPSGARTSTASWRQPPSRGSRTAVLDGVEQDHLSADECPRRRQPCGQVEHHMPQLVDGGRQRWKSHNADVHANALALSSLRVAEPAETARGSGASSKSAARAASPGPSLPSNGHNRGTRTITSGSSSRSATGLALRSRRCRERNPLEHCSTVPGAPRLRDDLSVAHGVRLACPGPTRAGSPGPCRPYRYIPVTLRSSRARTDLRAARSS